jgi:hypothetical protein
VSLEDHPLVTKLATFMRLSEGDLEHLENVFEAEKSVRKQTWSSTAPNIAI